MKFFSKHFGVFELVLIFLLIPIFYYLTNLVQTDIEVHARLIKEYALGNQTFQINFLYYFTVYFLSFFTAKTSALLLVSVYVLSTITFLKYYLVKRIIISEIDTPKFKIEKIASIFSFLLLFSFSLPSILINYNLYYILSFTPNVWHNSTTIFVMPFSILLFWLSAKQITEYKKSRLYWITILIMLNIFIKPSFIFVYIAIYPMIMFKKHFISRMFWINMIPILLSIILISTEYYLIYKSDIGDTDDSSIIICFFKYYYIFGKANGIFDIFLIIFTTIVSSFLFPIIVLVKNKSLLREEIVQFALSLVVFSIIIGVTFCETGARSMDGNFLWQNYITSFILFFVCVIQLLKIIKLNNFEFKAYKLEIISLLLHFIACIIYFIKIINTDLYL